MTPYSNLLSAVLLAVATAAIAGVALAQSGGRTPTQQEADRFVARWIETCRGVPAYEQDSLLCSQTNMAREMRQDLELTRMVATAMCQRLVENCRITSQAQRKNSLASLGTAVGCRETVGVDVPAGCGVAGATVSRCGPDSEFGRILQSNHATARSFVGSLPGDVRQRIPALDRLVRVTAVLATTARAGQNVAYQACLEEIRSDSLFAYCETLLAAGDGRYQMCIRAHSSYQARAVAVFANKTVPDIVRQVLVDALGIKVP